MEGVAAAGPLTDGQQQYFKEGLDAREQAYVKAQVSVPVHEEWSAYWTAALSGNAFILRCMHDRQFTIHHYPSQWSAH